MDLLKRIWLVVRRRWLVVFAALAVALILASLLNGMQRREYTASTALFLRAPDNKSSASAYQGDLFSRQRAQTYVSMFSSDDLAQKVIDRLGLDTTAAQLVTQVSAAAIKDTVLITVFVVDNNAQRAANIANAYGEVFGEYVAEVEDIAANPDLPPLVAIVKPATAENAVAGGTPFVSLLVGSLLFALIAAAVILWLLERFDSTIRSRRQIEDSTGVPVIGTLPHTAALQSGTTDQAYWAAPEFAEAARRLSINVDHLMRPLAADGSAPVLAVASVAGGEGKSVVAGAITQAMADRGYTVGFVDADDSGQSTVPATESSVEDIDATSIDVVSLRGEGLSFSEADLRGAIDGFTPTSDIVIIDGPAFRDASEAQTIAELADAVLVVVRPGQTQTTALERLTAAMGVLDTPVIGIVANQANETATADTVYA